MRRPRRGSFRVGRSLCAYGSAVGDMFGRGGCVLWNMEAVGGPGTPAFDGLKVVPSEWFAVRNHDPGCPLASFAVPGRSIW